MRYPLRVIDERVFPPEFSGTVHVWDIDKTYLSTAFSSLRGLSRIPVEFAIDKHAILGMPEVLRGLRAGPGDSYACVPIYFVSASPPQLRKVLEHKMLLDRVEHDGVIFKDWWAATLRLSPGRLFEQVGFKLCALLTGRLRRPHSVEFLYGDDAEADAEAYDLYARLVGGAVADPEAELAAHGVSHRDTTAVLQLLRALPSECGTVAKIFIHTECGTPVDYYDQYEGRVIAVRGAAQLALALLAHQQLSRRAAHKVLEVVVAQLGSEALDELVADALARQLVPEEFFLAKTGD